MAIARSFLARTSAVAVLALGLAACSSDTDAPAASSTTPAAGGADTSAPRAPTARSPSTRTVRAT
jgi:hypothetical protein